MALSSQVSPFPGEEPVRREALRVFVRGLEVQAGIGVYDHEHGRLQRLVIDVMLEMEPHAIERLGDTVNYETVAEAARAIAAEGHVGLVETFAERLGRACLQDRRVIRAAVRVEKPGALEAAAAPGCEIVLAR